MPLEGQDSTRSCLGFLLQGCNITKATVLWHAMQLGGGNRTLNQEPRLLGDGGGSGQHYRVRSWKRERQSWSCSWAEEKDRSEEVGGGVRNRLM